MQALILAREHPGTIERLVIGGAVFLALSVRGGSGWRAKRSARRAGRALKRMGVHKAVFPQDYGYEDVFAACGIGSVDTVSLQKKTAAAIARFYLRQRSFRRVVLVGEGQDAALRQGAFALSGEVRQLALELRGEEEQLARQLRFSCGVAAETGILPRSCTQEDLVLLFSPREGWERAEAFVVPLFDAAFAPEYFWPREIADMGLASLQFLSALCAAGALCAETLCVRRIGGREAEKLSLQMT